MPIICKDRNLMNKSQTHVLVFFVLVIFAGFSSLNAAPAQTSSEISNRFRNLKTISKPITMVMLIFTVSVHWGQEAKVVYDWELNLNNKIDWELTLNNKIEFRIKFG